MPIAETAANLCLLTAFRSLLPKADFEVACLPSLREMTSCTVSASSLVNFLNMCKSKMEDPLEYILREVLDSGVANFDETYLRVNGKQQYMHTASTPDATYQAMEESRGTIGMDNAGIITYFNGIAIHDC